MGRIAVTFLLVLVAVTGGLSAADPPLFFGEADRIGAIDIETGAVILYPSFGYAGYLNTLVSFEKRILYVHIVGTGVGSLDTDTGIYSLLAAAYSYPDPRCCIESLAVVDSKLYFGGSDHIGTIDPETGTVAAFPALGYGAYVNALASYQERDLYANIVGTGVGSVDPDTGAFTLIAPAPASPDPLCCVESLAVVGKDLFFGDRDRIGKIDLRTAAVTVFPDLGLGGYVNALAADPKKARLHANVVGTGVGEVDLGTGAFTLVAAAPVPPGPQCCTEALHAFDAMVFGDEFDRTGRWTTIVDGTP